MTVKKIYWDTCCFISLIQREPDRYSNVRAIYEEAEKGNLVIHTSTLTISELCKVRCDPKSGSPRVKMDESGDAYLDRFFENDFFWLTELSPSIARMARSLYRAHPQVKITNDAVHLATAISNNVDEMHTYDGNDLLGLSQKVQRMDGESLLITPPQPVQGTLLAHDNGA